MVVAALAGCVGSGSTPAVSSTPSPSASVPAAAGEAVELARRDAGSRTGIAASSWQVVEVRAVEWPDAGLGCPQPGAVYAQVVTPGYRIKLAGGGRVLEYHSGAGRVVYCAG
jgi:hypothetical protein